MGLLKALGLQLLFLPVFLGLGLLATALTVFFGRGVQALSHLGVAVAVAAGAYFPVTLFPPVLQKTLTWVSPFTLFLQGIRQSLDPLSGAGAPVGEACVWIALSLPLGYWAFGVSVRYLLKRGSQPL